MEFKNGISYCNGEEIVIPHAEISIDIETGKIDFSEDMEGYVYNYTTIPITKENKQELFTFSSTTFLNEEELTELCELCRTTN